jgi:hypothetical protein
VLEDFSIFYYRIAVANMDITIKLYYLGEIGADKESKTLLLTLEKKSGTLKNCVNAMRKGLYMFEFDNTYSWLNGKAILYENVVYTPLEIKSSSQDEWIGDYYLGIFQNEIENTADIAVVQQKVFRKPNGPTASLSKGHGTFTLMATAPESSYQYETDSIPRMELRIAQLLKKQP